MTTFYTSDTHFNHANIIRPDYCKGRSERYATIEDMNRDFIARWNARVLAHDIVWHLGDFALGQWEDAKPIFDQLHGYEKHLILGNHDRTATQMRAMGWTSVSKGQEMTLGNGKRIYLAHHPQTYEKLDRMKMSLQLCGHVHERWTRGAATTSSMGMGPDNKSYVSSWGRNDAGHRGRIINVGVDVRDFQPVTLAELLEADELPRPPA